ncbi:MAG: substrate-binding domain-containing protein [Opitutaceae bacterium]|nr:substrate-binding domain-containing protein [Opitutaceae bacterium]
MSPTDLPQRIPLATRVADCIRRRIESGEWREWLPGERRLSDLLQVSRPTIRAATHLLGREGLIDIRCGRRARVLPAAAGARTRAKKTRLVGLVAHEPIETMGPLSFRSIARLREHLSALGYGTLTLIVAQTGGRRRLEAFTRENDLSCCVLVSVGEEIQRWFAARDLPALVLGSRHPAVNLPSFDVDYRAACRHAAGVLLRNGHARIAFLVPNSGAAGDLASERGFIEAFDRLRHAAPLVARHNGTARNIAARLDALLGSASPPTALVVARPWHVFAVMVHLLRRGVPVPGGLSLIARDHDLRFGFAEPPVAHYRLKPDSFERHLARLMTRLINSGGLPREPQLVFPDYCAGGTVAPPPAA